MMFAIDLQSGEVAACKPERGGMRFERSSPIEAPPNSSPPGAHFGLLRWFKEYTNRLGSGYYHVMPLKPEEPTESLGICLCPPARPEATFRVTNGVEVSASPIYMPEHPQGWTYSIALRLVGSTEERGFAQCMLDERTWIIQEEGRDADRVNGKGVIGLFPILVDGGWILNR